MSVTPRLLVSVRDAAEAEAALAGGADVIDVKEPSRGPLGRADLAVIADVLQTVARRAPVSAALGELRDAPLVGLLTDLPHGLEFVKWGLAGLRGARWDVFVATTDLLAPGFTKAVAVGYADWREADAPRPAEMLPALYTSGIPVFMLDTWQKDGNTLLDWMTIEQVAGIAQACRAMKKPFALAGSLGPTEIEQLLPVAPDWFAVRGAACEGGRGGRVTAERVRALADLLKRG